MAYLSDDRPEPFDRYNSFSREGNFKAYVVNLFIRIIIIIRAFVRRTMSASELNLRRRQSLGGEDG